MRIVTSSVQVLTRYHLKIHNPVVIKNCQAMHSRHYLHSTRWLDKINAYERTISQSGNNLKAIVSFRLRLPRLKLSQRSQNRRKMIKNNTK